MYIACWTTNLYSILTFIVLLNAPFRNRSKASYWIWRVCMFLPDSLFIRCCEFRFFSDFKPSLHISYNFILCTYVLKVDNSRTQGLSLVTYNTTVSKTCVVVKYVCTLCMSCTPVEEIITTTCGYNQSEIKMPFDKGNIYTSLILYKIIESLW